MKHQGANTLQCRRPNDARETPMQRKIVQIDFSTPKCLMLAIACLAVVDCRTDPFNPPMSKVESAIRFCSAQLSYSEGLSARLSSAWDDISAKSGVLSFGVTVEKYYGGILADPAFRDFLESTGTTAKYFIETILECQFRYLEEHSKTVLKIDRRRVPNSWTIRNEHCQDPQAMNIRVSPTGTGWLIEPTTIEVTNSSSSSKSTFEGIFDKSETGYSVRGRVVNNGTCVKVDGVPLIKDGRGSLTIDTIHSEYSVRHDDASQP